MAQNPPPATPSGEADPSMDDILASIRRILSDEEKAAKTQPAPGDGVLKLDASMMIDDEAAAEAQIELAQGGEAHGVPVIPAMQQEPDRLVQPVAGPAPTPEPIQQAVAAVTPLPTEEEIRSAGVESLIAPEAAAMAASSVSSLMRTLMSERHAAVHRGGPTIEDMVREEIRPLLKGWLDRHLPDLVERLVRTEIERVVGRITG